MGPDTVKCLVILATIALVLALVIWLIWGNRGLQKKMYKVYSDRLPAGFDGFRIAQVSDLHNTQIGKNNQRLLNMLREEKPDMIAITGDLFDSRKTDIDAGMDFVKVAMKIAPCYYISGNHESRLDEYEQLKLDMLAAGVVVLEDDKTAVAVEEDRITVMGLQDPAFIDGFRCANGDGVITNKIDQLQQTDDGFTVLLSHRPEWFKSYVKSDADLVLCGHAHGGQIRLPLLGGLYTPGQGLFPTYDAGLFYESGTTMIISRGIGNSAFPFRINNRPELVVVELHVK